MKLGTISSLSFVFFAAVLGGIVPGAADSVPLVGFSVLAGNYTVVSVRRSDIISPTAPTAIERDALGRTVRISGAGIFLDGISCNAWTIVEVKPPAAIKDDPALVDLRLPPISSGARSGDYRIERTFDIACEGESFTTILQADSRVLAMTVGTTGRYLVLEKPLQQSAQKRLARQLIDMKFLSQRHPKLMGQPMISALRAYYGYRTGKDDAEIPWRPAITMNLLDGLGVF